MMKCSDPEMKNVLQDILNNITSAQLQYQTKHSQSRPVCSEVYRDNPLSGATGVNNRVAGSSRSSNVCPAPGSYKKTNTYNSYMQNRT
jgi:hypothetical protein